MPPRKGWEEEGEEKRRVVSLVKAVPKAIDTKDKDEILRIYDTYDPMFCSFEETPDFLGRVDGPKFKEFIDGLGKLESSAFARKDVRVEVIADNDAVDTGM